MAIEQELLDNLFANHNYQKPEDLIGENGLLKQLTKAILERALQAEMTVHLGHEKHGTISTKGGNARNGKTGKTLKGDFGNLPIVVPRDRDSSFEPVIVPKGKTRFAGFDNNIISLYARGMTTREIKGHLEDIYGVEVSPSLISTVTDAVNDEVKIWQNRSLDVVYPIVYMDVIRVKGRSTGHVLNKAVYLAIGITMDGVKEVLGMWVAETEGAKFWLHVVTELRNRGVQDIFIACVDGLKGFPEAIETVFPHAQVQLCIVHMVRNSLKYVSWKQRKEVATDLKKIYQSSTAEQAEMCLVDFGEKWDKSLPSISQSWRKNWERITPFFAYPPEIRKVIYTTNAIESLNMSLRRVTKHRGSFPNDESILKLLYLALKNIAKKWTMPIRDWKAALNRFSILFGDRIPAY